MRYCFGVDVGGTTIKIGFFQEDGVLKDKWEIITRKEHAGEKILPDIAESILKKLEEYKVDKAEIVGVGVGVPAPIKEDGILYNTANLGWKYKEVKKELEELTGFSVATINDANAAALGEMWKGSGMGHENVVMVTLGTGVGGCVISEGTCLVGGHGAGGEIGHVCVNYAETQRCGCGKKGCLEQYASATGIARLARERLAQDDQDSVLRQREHNTAKDVFDAVKSGDAVAEEIAIEFGKYLGHGLANVATVADPTVFVVGGGVSKAGEILFDYVREPYMENAFFANKEVEFKIASLGNDAGIYGAAKLVL